MARMKKIGEVLESPALSASLAEGRRLLRFQAAAEAVLRELGMDSSCRVAGATDAALQLRVADSSAATRLLQVVPSFLAAFNRRAETKMKSVQVRVSPSGGAE